MDNISSIGSACVGCRSCELVCPRDCITIQPDKQGFLYPVVDETRCVKCGACINHCAQAKSRDKRRTVRIAYAVKNKDKASLFKSASGGAADVAATIILKAGGVVFGAVYDEDLRVHHIGVTDIADKERLQSSKYVQSDLEDTFAEARYFLESGKLVLFTGTPCQIDGLYAFLGKKYEKLYTLDLICHGVPSPLFFRKYIENCEKVMGEKVVYYNFRSKEKRGWGTQYLIKTKRKVRTKQLSLDCYGSHFMSGDCYRESCYYCQYANLNRPADITVGDFWGVTKCYPAYDSSDGISLVLINSEQGIRLLELMKDSMEIWEIKMEEALMKQENLKKPAKRPQSRDMFYERLESDDYISDMKLAGGRLKIIERVKAMMPRKVVSMLKRFH